MFKQVNRRFIAALMAFAVVISNVIAPVSPAFAHDGNRSSSDDFQVFCSLDKSNGKWKAHTGSDQSSPEFALKDNAGNNVYAQNGMITNEMKSGCQTQPIAVPEAPVTTPATCSADGSLTLANTPEYTWSTSPAYTGPGTYTVTAAVRNVSTNIFADGNVSETFKHIVVQPQLSGQACPPAPKVEYTNWSYGIVDCSTLQAMQTRVKTTTPYVWFFGKWVPDVFHATVTTETQQRDLTSFERMLCAPKPKGTVVYGNWIDSPYKCGDTTVDQTRKITTTTYSWNGTEWAANTSIKTDHKSRPATIDERMSCASQTQPTCETNGTLTLPSYKGDKHQGYEYVVTIGLSVKTYSADHTVTIHNIPQGATVSVKLVSDDCFHDVIFTKDYTFDFADCITIPEPQQTDECGPDNASWVLPADTNKVHWSINANGHLIATAIGGRFTNGHTTFDFGVAEDSNEVCPPVVATPVKPQVTDCTAILPITRGITYKEVYLDDNGNIIDPSQAGVVATHQGVLATANAGYVLAPNNDGGKYLNNGSYLYTLDLTSMHCGQGDVTPPVVAPPAVTTTSALLPTPAELPHTGSSLSGLLVTLLATLSTYGVVYFLQPKRR